MISKDTKVLIIKKTLGCSLDLVKDRRKPKLQFEDICHHGKHIRALVGYFQKMMPGGPATGTHIIDYESGSGTGDFYRESDFIVSYLPDELFDI